MVPLLNFAGFQLYRPLGGAELQHFPLFVATVSAGFPSPAEDHIEGQLDLHSLLVHHPAATFFVRASGQSMLGAGIQPGDLLVVDRSITPGTDQIVIALLDGEFTVKRLQKKGKRVLLCPENPQFQPIEIGPQHAFEIWGVVTAVIHQV